MPHSDEHPKPKSVEKKGGVLRRQSYQWLKTALELRKRFFVTGRPALYVWAVFVGVVGALCAIFFEHAVDWVQNLLTGTDGIGQLEAFVDIPDWRRVAVPAVGGLIAGLILLFTHRFVPHRATEYMEAISLGDGYVPPKPSLLRSLSAVFTIGSGTAIGREGPLIQTAAAAASAIGCRCHLSAPRLRLMVACAAAAGMSAAFHTPLAGGFFICEIIMGALTVEILAPILVSSCAGYLTLSFFGEQTPIYPAGSVFLNTDTYVVLCCVLLGVIASLAARAWLWMLKYARAKLNGRRHWLPVRMALAGALVGAVALWNPEIVGNGAHMIRGLVDSHYGLSDGSLLLLCKVLLVAIVFGVGTVGGVLTPSLTIGCMLGFIFNSLMFRWGFMENQTVAYALVGMAAFFTTAASAPLTSIILVIEFTMAGHMIFPTAVAVLVSYCMARFFKVESMYHDSLVFGKKSVFEKPMWEVRLSDIVRKLPPCVHPKDTFGTIVSMLLRAPSQVIFVVNTEGKYIGSIIARDILEFARNKDLADAVIALDLVHCDLPVLHPEMTLPSAVGVFASQQDRGAESLPQVDALSGELLGFVNKTDLYLAMSEIMRREKVG